MIATRRDPSKRFSHFSHHRPVETFLVVISSFWQTRRNVFQKMCFRLPVETFPVRRHVETFFGNVSTGLVLCDQRPVETSQKTTNKSFLCVTRRNVLQIVSTGLPSRQIVSTGLPLDPSKRFDRNRHTFPRVCGRFRATRRNVFRPFRITDPSKHFL